MRDAAIRRGSRTLVMPLILAVLVASAPGADDKGRFQSFRRWLAAQVGQIRLTLDALSRVRGERSTEGDDGESRLRGTGVYQFDLDRHTESRLATCGTPCWSPAIGPGGRVFFLNRTGILSADGNRAPLVPVEGASEILGFRDEDRDEMLLLKRSAEPVCRFELVTVNLRTGTTTKPAEAPMRCFSSRAGIPKAGWISNGRVLDQTDETFRRLLVGRVTDPGKGIISYQKLIPEFDNERPRRSRFDAVWRDDHTVVYLMRASEDGR